MKLVDTSWKWKLTSAHQIERPTPLVGDERNGQKSCLVLREKLTFTRYIATIASTSSADERGVPKRFSSVPLNQPKESTR